MSVCPCVFCNEGDDDDENGDSYNSFLQLLLVFILLNNVVCAADLTRINGRHKHFACRSTS